MKWYQFSLDGGAELKPEAFGCPDCGLVWMSALDVHVLRDLIDQFAKAK